MDGTGENDGVSRCSGRGGGRPRIAGRWKFAEAVQDHSGRTCDQAELGACADLRPILEKGDNFKVPEEKTVQRFIKEFLTGKGGTGGKPSVEFRRHRVD